MSSQSPEGVGPARTLADVLLSGPLSLSASLRYSHDVAVELRDLHEQTRAYGKLSASSVLIGASGARLLPLRTYWDHATPERDVQAFGAVLYQMLTGTPPPATWTAADVGTSSVRLGVGRMRASAMKLALKCSASNGPRLSMQQVATELRLLGVLQRQEESQERPPLQERQAHVPVQAVPEPQTWQPAMIPDAHSFLDISEEEIAASKAHALTTAAKHATPQGQGLAEAADVPRDTALLRETSLAGQPETADALPPGEEAPTGLDRFGQPSPAVRVPPEPAQGGNCPKCDSAAVFVSRARSRWELLLERWRIQIVRCHRCYHRYVVIGRLKISKNMPVGTQRKFRPKRRS